MCLVLFGIVYANAEPDKKAKGTKYEPIDLCTFTASMEVGHFVELKACNKCDIKLVQVPCDSIGRDGGDFPCYKGSDVIEVRANFPGIFNASLDESSYRDMLKKINLYWENGANTIQGTEDW